MNTLSLDEAYGMGSSMQDTETPPKQPAPPPPPVPQPPVPQYQPKLHPQLQTERRRQVRFNDDPRKRFARVDGGVVVDSSSWMDRNKTLVTLVTALIIVILIVVLVMVCRKPKHPSPLAGGAVPTYVGASPGWGESVSQFASYY